MSPSNHLHSRRPQGCPKCGNRNLTTEDFIRKSKFIHGDDCSYGKTEYENAKKKVIITCERDKTHGDFLMTPNNHLSDQGCPKCARDMINVGYNESKYFRPFIKDYFKDFKVEFQYPVEKKVNPKYPFLVDVVIFELNIAFEYDEKHHKYQQNQDEFRQKIIENKMELNIIRISDELFMGEIRSGGTGKEYFEKILKK